MFCFNLRRLLPGGVKPWRRGFFTTKPHRSEPMKKPENRINPTTKSFFSAALCKTSNCARKNGTVKVHRLHHSHGRYSKKRTVKIQRLRSIKRSPPVSINHLFVVNVYIQQSHPENNEKFLPKNAKKSTLGNREIGVSKTGKGEGRNEGRKDTADDMWESLVLASPQMHGINERAEEFITRFRAEMQLQETSASHFHI